MANKTNGYKDAREAEGMNTVTFYPEAPVFGKNDIDEVPEEHRQQCVLVSWSMGGPERVFTESEVKNVLEEFAIAGDMGRLQAMIIAKRHGIVLDPA